MSEQQSAEIGAGIATVRGYCYACPCPIEVGDGWRMERVGSDVPHLHRVVHDPACPAEKDAPAKTEADDA